MRLMVQNGPSSGTSAGVIGNCHCCHHCHPQVNTGYRTEWLVWLVYSCCSHLEHRAYVKRFISLQFLNLRHSVGFFGQVISPSQNKHKQTSIPQVGFEPTIPAFKRAKTVHAFDHTATVIGTEQNTSS
jgi:hypothetical protein